MIATLDTGRLVLFCCIDFSFLALPHEVGESGKREVVYE
jgi:hypothetical protein